jgi:hypothetical protein
MKGMADNRVAGEAELASMTLGSELVGLLDQRNPLGRKIPSCPVKELLSVHERLVTTPTHTLV